MAEKDKFSKEGDKEFLNVLKKEVKLIGIITSNPTLRKFLKIKGIPLFGQDIVGILRVILITSINSTSYDKRFQKYLSNKKITFFSDVEHLINECYVKSDAGTREILKKFLSKLAIRNLLKIDPDIVWRTLFNLDLIEVIQKYQEQIPFKLEEFMTNIRECATETLEKAEKLKEFPDQYEMVAKNIVNEIKNNRESTRYLAGLILALFDLLNNNLKNLNNYISERNSAKFHYNGPFYRSNRCCWINDYLNPILYPIQADKYKSFKLVFEDWFFNTIEKIRHFKGHSEKDIIQDKLINGMYKIYIKEKKKAEILEFTLEELQSKYEESYDLLLLSKHIVARKLYLNDEKLFNYLAEPYKFD